MIPRKMRCTAIFSLLATALFITGCGNSSPTATASWPTDVLARIRSYRRQAGGLAV